MNDLAAFFVSKEIFSFIFSSTGAICIGFFMLLSAIDTATTLPQPKEIVRKEKPPAPWVYPRKISYTTKLTKRGMRKITIAERIPPKRPILPEVY